MGKPAQALTKAVRNYLHLKGWMTWKNSGGAIRIGDRFARFGEKGVADLCALHPQHGFLAVEIKASGEPITVEQVAWLESVMQHGGKVIVARSLADIERKII